MGDSIVFCAILTAMAVVNFLIGRRLFYPPFVQSVIWLSAIVIYVANYDSYTSLSFTAKLYIFVAVLGFSLGGFAIMRLSSRLASDSNSKRGLIINNSVINTDMMWKYFLGFSLIAIALSLFFVYSSVASAKTGPPSNILINLRYLLGYGGPRPLAVDLGGYSIPMLNSISAFTLLVFLKSRDRKYLILLVIIVLFSLSASIFSSGRGILLFSVIEILAIIALTNHRIQGGLVIYSIILILSVFSAGAIILNKGANTNDGLLGTYGSLISSFSFYMISGPLALSQVIPQITTSDGGINTFRTFYAILDSLGYKTEVISLVQDYVYIPQPTNVYTMLLPYIRDFGFYGVIFFQLLFGILHTAFYRMSGNGNPIATFWAAILYFPLLTQAFTDSYTSLLSTWIQYAFYSVVLYQFARNHLTFNRTKVELDNA